MVMAGSPRRPTVAHLLLYLSGQQCLLGQVEGRTADDAAYWLAQAIPAWRDAVRVVAIDMCTIYASAVRRMLPRAQLVPDLFHVVHLAVKMGTCAAGWCAASTAAAAGPAIPSTASRACWCATWSTCHRNSSPRSRTPWAAIRPGRRSPRPGSARRNSATP